MKKIIIGILLGLGITAIASVSPGQLIKSELINKILDLKISTGENKFSAQVSIDLNNSTASRHNIAGWVTCSYFDVGTSHCDYSGLNLSNPLNCIAVIKHDSFTNNYNIMVGNETASDMYLRFSSLGAASNGLTAIIECTKTGSDFNEKTSIRELLQAASYVF